MGVSCFLLQEGEIDGSGRVVFGDQLHITHGKLFRDCSVNLNGIINRSLIFNFQKLLFICCICLISLLLI